MDLLDQILLKIAEEDNTIILGRGGQHILKGRPDVYHILLVSDMDHRVAFVESKYKLTRAQAVQTVRSEDKKRTSLCRKFNKTDYDRPDQYHLTLNMSKLGLDKAADTVNALIT